MLASGQIATVARVMRSDVESRAHSIPIHECGEPLVEVISGSRIHVLPAYSSMGYTTASDKVFIRKGVAFALEAAADSLPEGFSLLVLDGLRSLDLQQEILYRFRFQLLGQGLPADEVDEMCRRYVSPVPQSPRELIENPPAHTTAAAVDVWLGDSFGDPLDLGTFFDDFSERAWPDHYENGSHSTADSTRRLLRDMLYRVMLNNGFAPYGYEIWHFELGTQRAAAYLNQSSARYGAAVPFQVTVSFSQIASAVMNEAVHQFARIGFP